MPAQGPACPRKVARARAGSCVPARGSVYSRDGLVAVNLPLTLLLSPTRLSHLSHFEGYTIGLTFAAAPPQSARSSRSGRVGWVFCAGEGFLRVSRACVGSR